jgi:hypothetical protein
MTLGILGLPNPNVTQLLVILGVLIVAAAIVTYRRPVFDRVSLVVQALALLIGEGAIYAYYSSFGQPFHWANHLLPAIVVASIACIVWLLVRRRPLRGQVLLVLPLHLFAMAPDPLFSLAIRHHDEWMNVFGGHIWVHFLPFRLNGWLVLAALASGIYVALMIRWLGRQEPSPAPSTV